MTHIKLAGNSEQVDLSVRGWYVVDKGGQYICGRYVVGTWSVKVLGMWSVGKVIRSVSGQ